MAMAEGSPWDVASRAAGVLAPESDLVANPDVAEFGQALAEAFWAIGTRPVAAVEAGIRLAGNLARIPPAAFARSLGTQVEPPVPPGKDKRFVDPAWNENS